MGQTQLRVDQRLAGESQDYLWSTDTAATNPGQGYLKANNADLTVATAIYINQKDNDGNILSTTWKTGRIKIFDPVNPANWAIFNLTARSSAGSGGNFWDSITASNVAFAGSFANGLPVRVLELSAGPPIPVGGATLARLQKNSATDYDASFLLAIAQVSSPSNPTGNATSTQKMQGLAISFTPGATGRMVFFISGGLQNDTINDGISIQPRYGTGTAPTNGAAVTGTALNTCSMTAVPAAAKTYPFSVVGFDNLTPGTTYWFDCSIADITGGTASINTLKIVIVEV